MNKIHVVIIGLTSGSVLLVIGVVVSNFGMCSFVDCDTQIEISSFEGTQPKAKGAIIEASFTVKNNGENLAENCYIRWHIPRQYDSYKKSENFDLAPSEEVKMTLKNTYHGTSTWVGNHCRDKTEFDMRTSARLICENSSTGLYHQTIFYDCP